MPPPTSLPVVALIVPPDQPPELILQAARAAEAAGLQELWLWEDCFASSGLAPAAAILGATERVRVGIGLMPAPLRAASLTAMEVATLARMFPGRFLGGLGHGILDWMGQAGVRVDSPMTLLREHLEAVNALLAGEEVTSSGRYVQLDRVRLRWPPEAVPPLLVGAHGPKTLALAGELADGVILADAVPGGTADLDRVRSAVQTVERARSAAGHGGPPEVVVFLPTAAGVGPDRIRAELTALGGAGATRVAFVAGGVDGPPASGEGILALVDVLAEADAMVHAG